MNIVGYTSSSQWWRVASNALTIQNKNEMTFSFSSDLSFYLCIFHAFGCLLECFPLDCMRTRFENEEDTNNNGHHIKHENYRGTVERGVCTCVIYKRRELKRQMAIRKSRKFYWTQMLLASKSSNNEHSNRTNQWRRWKKKSTVCGCVCVFKTVSSKQKNRTGRVMLVFALEFILFYSFPFRFPARKWFFKLLLLLELQYAFIDWTLFNAFFCCG